MAKTTPKEVHQYDVQGKYIKSFHSLNFAAKKLKLNQSGIRNAAAGKYGQSGGFQWRYKKDSKITPYDSIVYKYESQRKYFVKVKGIKNKKSYNFNSISEAEKVTGLSRATIINRMRDGKRTLSGWQFKKSRKK